MLNVCLLLTNLKSGNWLKLGGGVLNGQATTFARPALRRFAAEKWEVKKMSDTQEETESNANQSEGKRKKENDVDLLVCPSHAAKHPGSRSDFIEVQTREVTPDILERSTGTIWERTRASVVSNEDQQPQRTYVFSNL